MSPSTSALRGALVRRAWRQWIALGVDAVGQPEAAAVDPEALIALTAELGDADARLRELSTDWCVAYGRYVNGARLRQVVRELGSPGDAIGEFGATVATAGGPAWPMATQPRSYDPRPTKVRLDSTAAIARLRIRLRAAFGVNARADLLAALLAAPPGGLNAATLARITRFTKPSVAAALDALVLAGLVIARSPANERRFLLAPGVEILPGLRPPVSQPDWVTRFGVALRVHRFLAVEDGSPLVRAIEARRLVDPLLDRMGAEAMPTPNVGATGVEFGSAFDRWVEDLAAWLGAPGPR